MELQSRLAQPIIVTLHKYTVLPREPTSGVPLLTPEAR